MEEMTLFKSTKKIVKVRLVKKIMHYLTNLTSYLSKSSGQILLFVRFYKLVIFCQAPNTKSVPSCLMLKLGSFKNTETVIIAISGLKNNGDEERLSTMCPVTEVRAKENFNY